MSENGTMLDLAKDAGKNAIEQVRNRSKIHYVSYVLSSLLAYNWQHFLVLCKSTESIESILKVWNKTPDFSWDYFYIPILVGYILSIILPFCAAPVFFFTSMAKEIGDYCDRMPPKIMTWLVYKIKVRYKAVEKKIKDAEIDLIKVREKVEAERRELKKLIVKKQKFESYLLSLSEIYMDVPHINGEAEFERFFQLVKKKGLLQTYHENDLILGMVENMVTFSEKRRKPSPNAGGDIRQYK